MKIEQLLVQHFYNCRKVTLQGMGTFSISPDFVMPKENNRDIVIPEHAILFENNARAIEDDALINFITQQTRKIKPLASGDLDSYLALGKQFLNIGKPFTIEGIGILLKNQQGDLEFTKGVSFQSKIEFSPAALKEKTENPEISFASESKSIRSNKKWILIAILTLVLILTSIGYLYILIRKSNSNSLAVATPLNIDSANNIVVKTDSGNLLQPQKETITDGYTFKLVFMVTADSFAAVAKMKTLIARNHTVIMYKDDSLKYKLAEPFTLPFSDTSRIKDSLNNYYYKGKAFIELK